MLDFLIKNFERHIKETRPLIQQLTDEMLSQTLVKSGRCIGEIIIHMIRSFEYYSIGLEANVWNVAPYKLDNYDKIEKMLQLYDNVCKESLNRLLKLKEDDMIKELSFNRTASKYEILQELIEHSIQHRGQLLVYLRLINLEPAKIKYII